jgi:hypothetical protein
VIDDSPDEPPLVAVSSEPSRQTRGGDPIFWVEYRGDSIELRGGQLLVGRSAMCRLVLDDPLVSRQHGEFRVEDGFVTVYDLKSVNGVFVNGLKVERQTRLVPGDRVTIGSQDLILRARMVSSQNDRSANDRRRFAETIHEQNSDRPSLQNDESGAPEPSDDATIQGDGLDLLATVADKVLALRRGDDAERILATYLQSLLEKARNGHVCPPATAEKAAVYAVKLASVTTKAQWVDYCIELYSILERPLPGSVVDSLYDLLRRISGVNLAAFREYVAILHAVLGRLGPTEKFLVQRIESLERLAALR